MYVDISVVLIQPLNKASVETHLLVRFVKSNNPESILTGSTTAYVFILCML